MALQADGTKAYWVGVVQRKTAQIQLAENKGREIEAQAEALRKELASQRQVPEGSSEYQRSPSKLPLPLPPPKKKGGRQRRK